MFDDVFCFSSEESDKIVENACELNSIVPDWIATGNYGDLQLVNY